jgi:hypothetical protein
VTEEKSLAAGLLMNFFFLVGLFSFAVGAVPQHTSVFIISTYHPFDTAHNDPTAYGSVISQTVSSLRTFLACKAGSLRSRYRLPALPRRC